MQKAMQKCAMPNLSKNKKFDRFGIVINLCRLYNYSEYENWKSFYKSEECNVYE